MPFGFRLEELTALLTEARTRDALATYAEENGTPLKLLLAPEPPIDPLGDPEGTATFLRSYVAIGASGFSLRFDHHSRQHYCEQMQAMAELAPELDA
jgi:hypothetical protein